MSSKQSVLVSERISSEGETWHAVARIDGDTVSTCCGDTYDLRDRSVTLSKSGDRPDTLTGDTLCYGCLSENRPAEPMEAGALRADGGDTPPTVYDRIKEQLAAETIHGVTVTKRRANAVFCVVASSGKNNGGDVVDLRTVVVDFDDEKVRVLDNGLWVPRETDLVRRVTSLVARTSNDVADDRDDADPLQIGPDIDELLSTPMATDDYRAEQADGWGTRWGKGEGPPPTIYKLVDRLAEAGVPVDRFNLLQYGTNKPMERYTNRPVDALRGNYGVEVGRPDEHDPDADADDPKTLDSRILENDPLIVVDVDYPDRAPLADLPETFRVSSASGSDDRAHHYYRATDKKSLYDHFETWAVKPGWGDIWLAGEYVAGPGCYRPDTGRYDIVADVPIAEIDADELIEIVENSRVRKDGKKAEAEPEPEPEAEPEPEPKDDVVDCYNCGREIDRESAGLELFDGTAQYVCGGGCDE